MALVFRIIGLILTWGPLVISSVQKIEVMLGNKPGQEKKAAAMELISQALSVRGIEFNDGTKSIVSGLVDLVVSLLNSWNQWKKPVD
jgi:hypothetical protein